MDDSGGAGGAGELLDAGLQEKLSAQPEEIPEDPISSHAGSEPYWKAIKIFEKLDDKDEEVGAALLLESAELGFSPAQNYMGICKIHGLHGIRRSRRQAATWFEQAANQGDAFGQINIGLCYYSGTGVWKSQKKAKNWLLQAMSPDAYFPRPTPPADLLEEMEEVEEERRLNLLVPDSNTDLSKIEMIKAATLLSNIYRRERNTAESHRYAVIASGFEIGSKDGNYEMAVQAALNYAFGQGTEKDRAAAQEMLEFSKELQQRWVQDFVHSIGGRSMMDEFAMEEINEMLREMAEESVATMEYEVASHFSDKKSDDWDVEEAIPWFELAAERGRVWAMLKLAYIYNDPDSGVKDDEKAFTWFKKASETGEHHLGLINAGICYLHGIGTEKDPEAAQELFEKAKDLSFECYQATLGNAPDKIMTIEEILKWHKDSIKGSKADPHAVYQMGMRYQGGWGVKQSDRRAFTYFLKAGEKDHADAVLELADALNYGLSRKQDFKKARSLYIKADGLGSILASSRLAMMYHRGDGVDVDEDKAMEYYERALELDPEDDISQNNLTAIFEDRLEKLLEEDEPDQDEVDRLREQVIQGYTRASDLESAMSAYNLGRIYCKGEIVEQDHERAYKLLMLAVDRGKPDANYYLGQMHHYGDGMPKTPKEAAYYYRKAVVGDTTSTFLRVAALNRLIYFYRYGIGVPRDLEMALHWAYIQIQLNSVYGFKNYGDILLELEKYEEAEDFFRYARNGNVYSYVQGHAYARLSEMHRKELVKKPKAESVAEFLTRSTERNSAYGYFLDGTRLLKQQAYDDAATAFIHSLTESPITESGGKTSTFTFNGEEIVIDEYKAFESSDALYPLACLLRDGLGMDANPEVAWELFLMAAELGSAEAQFDIAQASLKDEPLAPPIEVCIELARMAVNVGHPQAEEVLEQLIAKLEAEKPEDEESESPEETSGSWWTELAALFKAIPTAS